MPTTHCCAMQICPAPPQGKTSRWAIAWSFAVDPNLAHVPITRPVNLELARPVAPKRATTFQIKVGGVGGAGGLALRSLPSCSSARTHACLHACAFACLHACALACLHACLHAYTLHACLPCKGGLRPYGEGVARGGVVGPLSPCLACCLPTPLTPHPPHPHKLRASCHRLVRIADPDYGRVSHCHV